MGQERDLTRLPIADWINLLSLSLTLVGVFALPLLDLVGRGTAAELFGLAVLLLVGYAFAIAGHYEMFNPYTARSMRYFPLQERVVSAIVGLGAASYVVIAALN